MRDDHQRLLDIPEAMGKIEKYSGGGKTSFENNELIQTWVIYHLQIMGEAASNISDTTKAKYPSIQWRNITGMRNILEHGYFGLDSDVVWSVVENDLALLKANLQS
ncbi:MAG: DUF86 domain-containing protein [Nitrospinae bacterium]|nr:DUF86 domain-containing protein [Nitrospinota bacterium]